MVLYLGPSNAPCDGPLSVNRRPRRTALTESDRVGGPATELPDGLAVRGEVLNAVAKVFVEEVFRWQREQVHAESKLCGAALLVPQRFGGSLQLSPAPRAIGATRQFWSEGNERCDDFVKFCQLSIGCVTRPAKE
jgi:hypothetical protein